MHSNGQVTRPSSYQNSTLPGPRPRFPNIKDLQDQAALLNVNENTPVSTYGEPPRPAGTLAHLIDPQLEVLLETASEAIVRAKELADSEPDKAYVQYLRASEITVNTIPHHPNYRTATIPHPGWHKEFAGLMMVSSLLSTSRIDVV
jgi:ubiquitin carboxyl-terminal hydrolase 8